jgi:hypothetical protein
MMHTPKQYDVLTLDTNVIQGAAYNFDGGLLGALKQFLHGPTRVALTYVVAEETRKHLAKQLQDTHSALSGVHADALKWGLVEDSKPAFLGEPDKMAGARLKKYIREIGARIIRSDGISSQELADRYFRGAPPFGTVAKKNEFPDAIALLSLEQWAQSNSKKVLAVSKDKDWHAFGEQSEWIDVVDDLAKALASLNADSDAALKIVRVLLKEIADGTPDRLAEAFFKGLSDVFEDNPPDADGSSAYSWGCEYVKINVRDFEFNDADDDFGIDIVQLELNLIVAQVDMTVHADVSADFSLSVWDSIDKEDVPMGSTFARLDRKEFEVSVLVTFEGDFEKNDVHVTKLELVGDLGMVDFGYIEPDYGEDDYDYLAEEDYGGLYDNSLDPGEDDRDDGRDADSADLSPDFPELVDDPEEVGPTLEESDDGVDHTKTIGEVAMSLLVDILERQPGLVPGSDGDAG